MASTYDNRQIFIGSLVSFIQKYGLDGVDIDWEYPAAPDRGGLPVDTLNYVLLMSEIREAFDAANSGWESTLTVPTSYWYLRGFDVTALQDYVGKPVFEPKEPQRAILTRKLIKIGSTSCLTTFMACGIR